MLSHSCIHSETRWYRSEPFVKLLEPAGLRGCRRNGDPIFTLQNNGRCLTDKVWRSTCKGIKHTVRARLHQLDVEFEVRPIIAMIVASSMCPTWMHLFQSYFFYFAMSVHSGSTTVLMERPQWPTMRCHGWVANLQNHFHAYSSFQDYIASCGCTGDSTHFPTAALSQMAYGSSTAYGPGCGRCFLLTLLNTFTTTPPYFPVESKSIVIKVTDLCPLSENGWCSGTQDKTNPWVTGAKHV